MTEELIKAIFEGKPFIWLYPRQTGRKAYLFRTIESCKAFLMHQVNKPMQKLIESPKTH